MADDIPTPPTPESGEEQYRRWVEHMKSSIRASGGQPPALASSAGSDSGLVTAGNDDMWAGATTEVIERSVMPRPLVTLSQTRVDAAPGQPVRVKIAVRNVGPLVETYMLSVVGPESAWLSIVPSEVSLFPGAEGRAALVIKPGRTSKLPSGDYVIGVMARSEVDPHESTVAELTIAVTPFYDSALTLSRTTLDIRRYTTTFAQITNNGNTFVDYRLDVADPDGYLRFKVENPEFTLGPGETVWKKITISAPLHLFGSARTLSMVATLNSVRDHTHGITLEDARPSIQRVTLVQRPVVRLRLGILGRIILLLLILGLIGAFILSRMDMTGSTTVKTGPPPPPQGFTVQTYEGNQVLLLWDAAPGASNYSIYAVGATGNAVYESAAPSASASASASASPAASASAAPSASPAATASTPSTPTPTPTPTSDATPAGTPAPSASTAPAPTSTPAPTATSAALVIDTAGDVRPVVAQSGALRVEFALARSTGSVEMTANESPTSTPSPSPSDSASADEASAEYDIEAPSCGDCTHVADVTGGTTRYIVTKTMAGQDNCYRIIATAGASTSLYTPRECVYVPTADELASSSGSGGSSSADGSSDGSGSEPQAACPPYLPYASPVSSSSLAVTWLPPSDYRPDSSSTKASTGKKVKGMSGKNVRERQFANPLRAERARLRELRAAATSAPAGVPAGGGTSDASSSSSDSGCSTSAQITGFELQRQLLSGWTTVSPAPAAQDTAVEVPGLQAATKYCFRMRSLSSPESSEYTATFCGKTSAAEATATPAPSSTPAPTPTPTSSAPAAASDPAGSAAQPSAAVVIENLRRR